LVREDEPLIQLFAPGGSGSLGEALSLEPAQFGRNRGVIVDDRHPGFANLRFF
jgi:hypothetical protein